ncbi:hypothetical protein CLV33_103279 [Jejuia pallidilutea]|uniref:Uncharacterized protein n=1 Tax=Jejuia pallidilutea TaxID=504487 RepID=A0A362X171_9FLAO|nr:hypothetical protein [Jejuia pallidilutea]PQV49641.1 hypothetical protein CLV33_103279 [Jejuia pallidilutea]
MSKDLPQQPQESEEVDLGQLFKMIGNMFDRVFSFIGSVLNKLFLSFVWIVFFIKKHIIKIIIAGIIGYFYGFFKQNKGEPLYRSTTVIKQNYDTGENLYRAIDYYNELIAEGDSVTLGKVLSIDSSKAASLIQLEVESVITENDKLKSFDSYTKELDSVVASTVTFENFIKNSKEYHYPVQRIIMKANEKDIFGTVVSKIVDKIVSTDYFRTEQKKDLDELDRLEKSILTSLEASQDLQTVYKKVLQTTTEKTSGSQTSIRIDNTEDKSVTKEFELYNKDIELRRELVTIQRRKEDKQFIIEIVSSQENQGTIDNSRELLGKPVNVKTYFAIILMLLASIILLTLHSIKFLEQYKRQI